MLYWYVDIVFRLSEMKKTLNQTSKDLQEAWLVFVSLVAKGLRLQQICGWLEKNLQKLNRWIGGK